MVAGTMTGLGKTGPVYFYTERKLNEKEEGVGYGRLWVSGQVCYERVVATGV